jgi:hypothetical protein
VLVVFSSNYPDRGSDGAIDWHKLTNVFDYAAHVPTKRICVRDGAEFFVHCSSTLAVIRREPNFDLDAEEYRHVLHDLILPKVLAVLGEQVLHGALLSVGGEGIAIIGPSGAGKSTLAAALNMRGAQLHSDDVFVIRPSATGFLAQGAYPSLRLWPDSLQQLSPAGRRSTRMTETSRKRCLQTDNPVEDQVPLKAIIVLDPASRAWRISAAKASQACLSLVANAFQFDPSDTMAAAANLKFMCDVAINIPTFILGRPQDYSQLPAICDAVFSTLESSSGSTHKRDRRHEQHVTL